MNLECNESSHVLPTCTYDTSYPIDWVIDVQRVMGSDYKSLGGHVVQRYGTTDGLCGKTVGLCAAAQRIIDEYDRRKRV